MSDDYRNGLFGRAFFTNPSDPQPPGDLLFYGEKASKKQPSSPVRKPLSFATPRGVENAWDELKPPDATDGTHVRSSGFTAIHMQDRLKNSRSGYQDHTRNFPWPKWLARPYRRRDSGGADFRHE